MTCACHGLATCHYYIVYDESTLSDAWGRAAMSLRVLACLALVAVCRAAFPDPLSPQCTQATIGFIQAQQPLNASDQVIQLIMASAHYPGDSGNYYSCHETFGAQFCLVNAPFNFNYNGSTYFSLGDVNTGLCIPYGCNENDIKLLAQDFYFPVLFNRLLNASAITSVQCLEPHTLHGSGAVITVILLIILAVLVAGGTYLRHRAAQAAERKKRLEAGIADEDEPLLREPKKEAPPPIPQMQSASKPKESKMVQILHAFDLSENWKDLLKSPAINNGLKALDGLRVCSMVCVYALLAHKSTHMYRSCGSSWVTRACISSQTLTTPLPSSETPSRASPPSSSSTPRLPWTPSSC